MQRIAPFLRVLCLAGVLGLAAAPGHAACYVDYKAKQDDPLRLHYGVMEVPDAVCAAPGSAAARIAPRLERAGWQLLDVMGAFGPEGLDGRRQSAGAFFLRF